MSRVVIFPELFSIKPDTDVTKHFAELFETVSISPSHKTLTLPKGTYLIRSKNASPRELYISNTIAEDEYPEGEERNMHRIALDMKGITDLEIDGSGSTLVIDGKMTNMVIENCCNITVKNIVIDTLNPDVHKMTVVKASPFYVTFKVDKTGSYCEENGQYYWYGTDYKFGFLDNNNSGFWMISARPSNYSHIKRNGAHPFSDAASLRETAPGVFQARFVTPKDYEVGQMFYFYPVERKNVGIAVINSKNIRFENITQHFNYSLAFVAQNSENITVDSSTFAPQPDSDIELASLADFVQISMCRGNIKINNCTFDSAGDDAANVHGFHFKIVEQQRDRITVKFCHPQSYGFDCLREGDIIAFIDPNSLLEVGRSKILSLKKRDSYLFDLVLTTYDPPLGVGGVIEDISACPNFEYTNNTVNRIVTRGVLATTRGRVLIENNRFLNTGMSGVLIADDAGSWYESGCVKNVTIRGNAFMNCEESAILIQPAVKAYRGAVHGTVNIENNLFILNNTHALAAACTEKITMNNNVYKGRAKYGRPAAVVSVDEFTSDCR